MSKFYNDGLKFECTGCGECCKLPAGRVDLLFEEAKKLSEYLSLRIDYFLETYCDSNEESLQLKDNQQHHCIFLSDDKCTVYEVRPLQCRTFPFWPENVKSLYRWKQIRKICPGIGEGKHYSVNEIKEIQLQQRQYN